MGDRFPTGCFSAVAGLFRQDEHDEVKLADQATG
jgi:hypothetical protein